jgi:hypothetical protein
MCPIRGRVSRRCRISLFGFTVAIATLLVFVSPPDLFGQRRPRGGSTWSGAGEIYWGGSVNVRYGRTSGIGLYPLIGYKITPQWSIGARLGYEYWWRDRIIPQIYAHAEGGGGNYDRVIFTGESDRVTYPFLFLGGGFSQRTGRRSWLLFEVLYEVIQDTNSPYDGGGPLIALGIGIGF